MSLRSARPSTVVVLLVALVLGLAAACVLNLVFPQAMFVAIVLGAVVVIVTTGVTRYATGRRWVWWFGLPATALLGLGTMMLSEDIAITQSGERIEAVVVDHTVDVQEGAKSTAYTHRYSLESVDGRPLDEPLEYRGKGGYDGVEEGTEIEVLVDPDGEVPTELTEEVDIGADIAVVVLGFLAVTGVFGAAAIAVARKPVVRRR